LLVLLQVSHPLVAAAADLVHGPDGVGAIFCGSGSLAGNVGNEPPGAHDGLVVRTARTENIAIIVEGTLCGYSSNKGLHVRTAGREKKSTAASWLEAQAVLLKH